jgi:hypothetical protein
MTTPQNIIEFTGSEQVTCRQCSTHFTYEIINARVFEIEKRNGFLCEPCSQAQAKAEIAEILLKCSPQARRLEDWQRKCPPLFLDTDLKHPGLPQDAVRKCMAWEYGPKGLLLFGDSGLGKSRVCWAIAKREFMAGRSVDFIDEEFAMLYAAAYSESTGRALAFQRSKIQTDLLLMDDTFKAKLTDSNESALFAIINKRSLARKPTILTLNGSGQDIESRMTVDRGTPLLRRLREFGDPVYFPSLKQTQIAIN